MLRETLLKSEEKGEKKELVCYAISIPLGATSFFVGCGYIERGREEALKNSVGRYYNVPPKQVSLTRIVEDEYALISSIDLRIGYVV
jgi:hypothetical protein